MRKTKIVCTIGPSSEQLETLKKMILAGMNVARLNFSHGNHEEHLARIKLIRQASQETGKPVAILLDTKGPEIRTHNMENGGFELKRGNSISIMMQEVLGNAERFSITYPELIDDVQVGSRVLIDDGLIELKITDVNKEAGEIKTTVVNSGMLKNKKGVNVPNVCVNLPGITDKDKEDILFGIKEKVDFIAASFSRKASDILEIRELLEQNGGGFIHIIPKIENQEGVDNIDKILQVSDGLMVARGDLGVEIPPEDVPLVQKLLIKKCNQLAKPVITATQMLDSMQRNPRPTRAEASDVANAIFDGTDAIMLSGESAAGLYPVESVQTMQNIAEKAETALNYHAILSARTKDHEHNVTDAIGQSVAYTASNLKVKAIIAPTESGTTARMISRYRPETNIIAITSSDQICRRLSLVWGVTPFLSERSHSTDEMLDKAVQICLEKGIVQPGDLTVITAGVPVNEPGTTNLMKIHYVGQEVVRGQGIGRKTATGIVVVANSAKEAIEKIEKGNILVTYSTDAEMMPAIEKCAGIITEEGGLTGHTAIVGINLEIPVVVGVPNAMQLFNDGDEIMLSANNGKIYKNSGHVI